MPNDALTRLYADYRGDAYFKERHGFKPWYTKAINDDIGGEAAMQVRRGALRESLLHAGIDPNFTSVLDHGGDRGQMLRDIAAPVKTVYEVSDVQPEPGVVAVDETSLKNTKWDLSLSCHVLEYLPDPAGYIVELVQLGHDETVYFFEVPDEKFRSFEFNCSRWQILDQLGLKQTSHF